MAKTKEPFNPFYVLLVLLGVVFLLTACAYSVMAFLANNPRAAGELGDHVLTDFLDRHGVELMAWELGLLAVASCAAMGLDRFRSMRRQRDAATGRASQSEAEARRQIE